jgi:putative DNA methylase
VRPADAEGEPQGSGSQEQLGLEAHASDLNPVAVLITKALVEIPPKFAGKPPVNPEARKKIGHAQGWRGARGPAEDVR